LFIFTDLTPNEIQELMKEHLKTPENKVAQIKLATEITKEIHGEEGLGKVKKHFNMKRKSKIIIRDIIWIQF
jgi:tyrosyl-tRNA synthetase